MSNFLAIATVTAALRKILEDALREDDFGGVTVTTYRPGGESNDAQDTRTNLYLYMVTPSAALRNIDMPNRNFEGNLIQRPQVALDLHYLLTFHGDDEELKPQRLLGNAVRALHDRPMLTRQMIRETINDIRFNTFLQNSNLADALEIIKLTPISLSLDELYKLWSVFFQTPYQLSVAYIATVVLIEGNDTPGITLPVRERNLYVVPFHQPVIEKILPEEGADKPILAESKLYIMGKKLRGDKTLVKINGTEVVPESITEKQVTVLLNCLSPDLRAGVHGIQVVHQMLMGKPPVPHKGVESNLVAFVLHPAITDQIIVSNPEGSGNDLRSADLTIKVKPAVVKEQRIVLLLNEISDDKAVSYTFIDESNDADTDTIKMHISGVKAADYLVRVQVDGVQSQLIVDSDQTSQTFNRYIDPKVRIP